MFNTFSEFLERHNSLIITTHDPADADGLGAELILKQVVLEKGKKARIINSRAIPEIFKFMDVYDNVETWTNVKETLDRDAALIIADTTDEYNIGELRDIIAYVPEVYVIDHHEPNQFCSFKGYVDSNAASTCEMTIELAMAAGTEINPEYAAAAYTGIVYDTGFFAYPKTSMKTFKAALAMVEIGVKPNEIYSKLNESASTAAIILQKKVFSTLELHNKNRVAVQVLRKEDLESSGAHYEDAEQFVNIPLKAKEIEASILIKQNKEGQIRCSMRSKGKINVSKIAQVFGGGGHVSAAGFRSDKNIEGALGAVLAKINEMLDKPDAGI